MYPIRFLKKTFFTFLLVWSVPSFAATNESITGKWKITNAGTFATNTAKSAFADLYKNEGTLEFLSDGTMFYGNHKVETKFKIQGNELVFENEKASLTFELKENTLTLFYKDKTHSETLILSK